MIIHRWICPICGATLREETDGKPVRTQNLDDGTELSDIDLIGEHKDSVCENCRSAVLFIQENREKIQRIIDTFNPETRLDQIPKIDGITQDMIDRYFR